MSTAVVAVVALLIGLVLGQRLMLGARTGAREAVLAEQLRAAESRVVDAVSAARRFEARSRELESALGSAREAAAALRATAQRAPEREALLERAESTLRDAFRALSGEALKSNNAAFLELARATLREFQEGAQTDLLSRQREIEHVVAPIQESLGRLDAALVDVERARIDAYSGLREQVAALRDGNAALHNQTGQLVRALRSPSGRGQWGECQLRRVIEMAGMVENCDFEEQVQVRTSDGRLRTDVIVHLPGGKSTVVDAKVPMAAYLDALEATDDTGRRAGLRDHARQVKVHVTQLGGKAYWAQLPSSPDFVIMYMPCESAFAAAVQEDPGLIDYAVSMSVIPAGPMTLLTHLKAAAYGWRQERIARNAERISELGRELYQRLGTLVAHVSAIGLHLTRAGDAYNQALGSLERRVLPQARRFKELGAATGDDLPELEPVALGLRGAMPAIVDEEAPLSQ